MNPFDQEIKNALQHGTDDAAKQKEDVWRRINHQLEDNSMRYNKRKKLGLVIGIAAALLITVTAVFTPVGQAAMTSIRDLFAPEKHVEIEIEGENQEGTYDLHVSTPEPAEAESDEKAVGYILYVDSETYTVTTEDGVDRIIPKDYHTDLPEVSMTIGQVKDITPDALAKDMATQLKGQYDTVYDAEEVEYPVKSIHITALEERGKMDNPGLAMVEEVYLIDNTQGGTFVATLKYFSEAAEGHGERLKAMLNEFTVVAK